MVIVFRIVVVLAFKAVYTLEKNRRQNDKKVLALYAEYAVHSFDPLAPSHEFKNERHDESSPPVRSELLPGLAPL